MISFALTSLGPFISKIIFFELEEEDFIAKFLTFKTMSVTSSLTPLIEENSCKTLSILIAVTAVPWSEDSKTLRSAFPSVNPKPLSKGSAVRVALYLASSSTSKTLYFLINLGDLKKAQGILRMIPKKHYLGEYAAIQISDLYSQLDEEEKAIKNLVNYNKFNQTFDSLIALGNFYRYEKHWTQALDSYESSLDIALAQDNQNIWEVFFNIGIVHERTDNWSEAETNFNTALSIYEDQPDVLNYLGYSYLDKDLDLKLAKELIEKAMSLKPNDPYIIDSMAWYYFKVGRFEEALSLLDYAIDMMPYDPTINDHYADALWKIGHKLQARYHWERAIELDTEGELKDQIKEKLLIGI